MEDASVLSSSKDTRQGGPPVVHSPTVRIRGVAVMSSVEVLDEERRGLLSPPR